MGAFADAIAAFREKGDVLVDDVIREVVVETGRRLIDRSPVLTGRFASNWNYGLESPDTSTTVKTDERVLHNTEEMPKRAGDFTSYLTNALPYGPALERGYSKKAPNGMVGLTAVEWPQIVELAVQRAKGSAA